MTQESGASVNKCPLVSVVVATYNRAHTIERALESIYAQTFHNYEVIVVDDGSTDETRSLIENHLEWNSFKYIHQENKGVAEARNTGVRNSRGEYVAFCDSDDFWLPNKIETQLPLFTADTVLVYSDVYIFEDAERPKARSYEFMTPYRGDVYVNLLRKNFIATSSVIVRKSLLQRPFLGQTGEDWQMWLSVAKKGLFDYVEEPLAYYQEHSQGLSKAKARLVKARLDIRKQELKIQQTLSLPDTRLVREVKRLILKDQILFCIFNVLPERIMKKIDALYYASPILRSVLSKTPLSN